MSNQLKKHGILHFMEISWHDFIKQGVEHFMLGALSIYAYIWFIAFCGKGPSWSWSYGSCIYNYLCNQCLSTLMLWIRILLKRDILDKTLCDTIYQWLATGRWFPPASSTNKTDRHDITEILSKVVLKTITPDLW